MTRTTHASTRVTPALRWLPGNLSPPADVIGSGEPKSDDEGATMHPAQLPPTMWLMPPDSLTSLRLRRSPSIVRRGGIPIAHQGGRLRRGRTTRRANPAPPMGVGRSVCRKWSGNTLPDHMLASAYALCEGAIQRTV